MLGLMMHTGILQRGALLRLQSRKAFPARLSRASSPAGRPWGMGRIVGEGRDGGRLRRGEAGARRREGPRFLNGSLRKGFDLQKNPEEV
ncbi:hypothetical protein HMPREF9440_01269 [Sutterella parvirubra YIT 11816]|uniref:Uncharacterized protein n=1 Tax=Sutterella parvirubra YIT 11816 TaxID=762967 RepID=H3KEV3_9BURK|nr:hypothetical protein HMPREF9440_01269 [Sutterella parvirubra YIT 11816]